MPGVLTDTKNPHPSFVFIFPKAQRVLDGVLLRVYNHMRSHAPICYGVGVSRHEFPPVAGCGSLLAVTYHGRDIDNWRLALPIESSQDWIDCTLIISAYLIEGYSR